MGNGTIGRGPFAKLAILAEDEYQALIDDVVAAGVKIAAIPLQVLEDMAIKLDGDLVPIFRLLGNERKACVDSFTV